MKFLNYYDDSRLGDSRKRAGMRGSIGSFFSSGVEMRVRSILVETDSSVITEVHLTARRTALNSIKSWLNNTSGPSLHQKSPLLAGMLRSNPSMVLSLLNRHHFLAKEWQSSFYCWRPIQLFSRRCFFRTINISTRN